MKYNWTCTTLIAGYTVEYIIDDNDADSCSRKESGGGLKFVIKIYNFIMLFLTVQPLFMFQDFQDFQDLVFSLCS